VVTLTVSSTPVNQLDPLLRDDAGTYSTSKEQLDGTD